MTAVAVGCTVLATLLVVRPPSRIPTGVAGARPPRIALLVAPGVLVAALVVPRYGGLLLVLGCAALGGLGLWRRRCGRRSAARISGEVLETCELLAGELGA
ncbi:MAG: hypothetical protein WBP61_03530, partial [Nocardioides sp.]